MYPNLYYFFKDLFGIELQGLKIVNSFGFFVAISFIVSAWVLTQELKRKQKAGLFQYTEQKMMIGAPATLFELITNFLLGFVFGFKIIGSFFIDHAFDDPQAFIFSGMGNWFTGILIGALAVFLKWQEKNKQKLDKPEERSFRIWPHDRVGDMVIYAAIFGFAGAKVFDILEAPASFMRSIQAIKEGKQDIASILSSGLTFYGGLIVATIAIIWYARKHKISIIHLADAIAPALMLAYAIGRIGCQVSGDGDWGIINSAYVADNTGHVMAASTEQFAAAMQTHAGYLSSKFGNLQQVPHHAVHSFLGLPDKFFAYTFPHNVGEDGVALANCTGKYCTYLPLPVFPTPFYETIASTLLFFVLWGIRKKLKAAGQMAGIYLMFNGVERFLIEKIRVNATYDIKGMHITQAEIISSIFIIIGIVLFLNAKKWFGQPSKPVETANS